jgi:hypothetical protein
MSHLMLNDCHAHLILQLTNIYETSNPHFEYNVCTVLADNHGYSAGIIQFTTGTGSALQVIEEYSKRRNPNEFTIMLTDLKRIAAVAKQTGKPVGDISGLENYGDAWEKASEDAEFREAQLTMLLRNYLAPAIRIARTRKLTVPGMII